MSAALHSIWDFLPLHHPSIRDTLSVNHAMSGISFHRQTVLFCNRWICVAREFPNLYSLELPKPQPLRARGGTKVSSTTFGRVGRTQPRWLAFLVALSFISLTIAVLMQQQVRLLQLHLLYTPAQA
jgi:hypothetical protein